jgi:hypothetical protein
MFRECPGGLHGRASGRGCLRIETHVHPARLAQPAQWVKQEPWRRGAAERDLIGGAHKRLEYPQLGAFLVGKPNRGGQQRETAMRETGEEVSLHHHMRGVLQESQRSRTGVLGTVVQPSLQIFIASSGARGMRLWGPTRLYLASCTNGRAPRWRFSGVHALTRCSGLPSGLDLPPGRPDAAARIHQLHARPRSCPVGSAP